MLGFIEGVNRTQGIMFPESLDEYIGDDNPVRFIDAFMDSLDLQALGFERAVPNETGRPPYYPGDLLKLYIYGYLNHVRSSRRLEKEADRNVELMWLLGKLAPDFKTIADFRRDNRQAIRAVCREFTLYCRELGMFGGELVAIDGSKFKAVNSRHINFTERRLKGTIQRLDEKIVRYLGELDTNDEQEPESYKPTAEELREKIEALKKRKREYEALQEQLEESGEKQISLADHSGLPLCGPLSYIDGNRHSWNTIPGVLVAIEKEGNSSRQRLATRLCALSCRLLTSKSHLRQPHGGFLLLPNGLKCSIGVYTPYSRGM